MFISAALEWFGHSYINLEIWFVIECLHLRSNTNTQIEYEARILDWYSMIVAHAGGKLTIELLAYVFILILSHF